MGDLEMAPLGELGTEEGAVSHLSDLGAGRVYLGRRVRCYWPAERAWFEGVLEASGDPTKWADVNAYRVVYDDGDFEDLELPDESVEILDDVTMLTPGKRPKTTAKPMVMEPAKRKQTLKTPPKVAAKGPPPTAKPSAAKPKPSPKSSSKLSPKPSPKEKTKATSVYYSPPKTTPPKRKSLSPATVTVSAAAEGKKARTEVVASGALTMKCGTPGTMNIPIQEVIAGRIRVELPQPIDVLERHDNKCCCSLCKAGLAKGKTRKGPKSKSKEGKKAKLPTAGAAMKRATAARSKLNKEFACGICKALVGVGASVRTPCGHVFCTRCLADRFCVNGGTTGGGTSAPRAAKVNKPCPTCTGDLKPFLEGWKGEISVAVDEELRQALEGVEEEEAAAAALQVAEDSAPTPDAEPEPEPEDTVPCEVVADSILVGQKLLGDDWRQKVIVEEREKGKIYPQERSLNPGDVELPPDFTVVYDENSVEEQKEVRRVSNALKTFLQHLETCRVDEAQRAKDTGGVRADGKKISQRPDLKAQTKMRESGGILHTNHIGAVPGIRVGAQFNSRAECIVVGLHSHWLNGIDCVPVNLKGSKSKTVSCCCAIMMSGGYEDDVDSGESVIYTGEGGNDLLHAKHQISDQRFKGGNLALQNSCALGVPVRLIRSNPDPSSYTKQAYVYDGLYRVQSYWLQVGVSGYKVCKFHLERLPGQRKLDSASVHWGNNMGGSLPRSQKAEARPGFIMADISLGMENIPIPVVNTYDEASPSWAPPPMPLKPGRDKDKQLTMAGVKWPSDPSERARAFVYATRPIHCADVPRPPAPPDLTAKQLMELNGGYLPYVSGNRLHGGCCSELLLFETQPGTKKGPDGQNAAQDGIRFRLEVFRTETKGWGVRSWDRIPAGSFVCEFTGEVLTSAAADARGEHENSDAYQGDGEFDEYMFELALNGMSMQELLTGEKPDKSNTVGRDLIHESRRRDEAADAKSAKRLVTNAGLSQEDIQEQFHMDGKYAGSVARFINHSSEPNLNIVSVLYDHHDPRMPHLCLYASHTIPPLTELTYDYGIDYHDKLLGDNYEHSRVIGSR